MIRAIALMLALVTLTSCTNVHSLPHVRSMRGDDLPLIEVLPEHGAAGQTFVVLTGDGGWRAIDRDVTKRLTANGATVIGFLSNRYFAQLRSEEEVVSDLVALFDFAAKRSGTTAVHAVGFSRGADTLAFVLPHLTTAQRNRLGTVVLLSAAPTASLEVEHWWERKHVREIPLDVAPLSRDARLLCVGGSRERESLCRLLRPPARSVTWPGGHHLNGDYAAIGDLILHTVADDTRALR